MQMTSVRFTCVALMLGAAGGAFAASEDETVMARKSTITLQEAMRLAVGKVPGRVFWSAREKFDGGTYVMVEIVTAERTRQVVTIEDGTGKIVKVEPAKEKPVATATVTGEAAAPKKPALKGTIAVGDAKTVEYPYLAKVSMEDAIKAVLKRHPGKLVEVYIYAESGFLLYGIEVSSRVGRITLAKVDAGTGRIVGTEKM